MDRTTTDPPPSTKPASPSDAIALMARTITPVPIERIDLTEARGRVLAHPVVCDRDSPAFDHSSMDGYAVRTSTLTPGTVAVVGEVRIGAAPPPMPTGPGVVRIVTGGAIPQGADAVIRREDVREHTGPDGVTVEHIEIAPEAIARTAPGACIRRRGENARAGEVVIEPGTVLTAAAVGVLGAVGEIRPTVFRRVRVAVITTGDECVAPDHAPGTFEIRDASAVSLPAILGAHAWIEVVMRTHIRDAQDVLERGIADALERADLVILTGGVSKGHRDGVRPAIETVGSRIMFHGLPQRPGNPMLGAIAPGGQPVFGLPGNPVSSMVTCLRIAIPVVGACAGLARWPHAPGVRLAHADGKSLPLWWHRLVRMNDAGAAELVDTRGSGDVIAASKSDGFIEVPPGDDGRTLGPYPYYAWPM